MMREKSNRFLEKHKITRIVCFILLIILLILIAVFLSSWDSLAGWLITGDQAAFRWFIFWAAVAVAAVAISALTALVINKRKK